MDNKYLVPLILLGLGITFQGTEKVLIKIEKNNIAKKIKSIGLGNLSKAGFSLLLTTIIPFKFFLGYAIASAIIKTIAQQKGIEICYIEY